MGLLISLILTQFLTREESGHVRPRGAPYLVSLCFGLFYFVLVCFALCGTLIGEVWSERGGQRRRGRSRERFRQESSFVPVVHSPFLPSF